LLRSAKQGELAPRYNIASLYEKGWGVPQDIVLAHMWYNLAAAIEGRYGGFATMHRDTLADRMTPAQIAEAQKLAREWKPKPETPRPEKLGWWQWALDFFR
jgi:TPR repeat protein